ncbi:hypothetical protein Syn7502_01613 [Synechococcus sp. PCC 7502]|uniref:hypothetical protein n=1 Tax=Synechococcus sp. PCC 7502 TaxID=1173263 RepID=UPI00029FACFA|nr:hypothetical protein [Synechococcus sp. PCC 7502]AFY73669.1 hypothetical protein Syn7502_01613 [Synechococcus sp. PCC 7502]
MRSLNFLALLLLANLGGINQGAIAAIFRTEDKIYITDLKPKAKVEITVQRITFRKLVADSCGEVSFESTTIPALVLVANQIFTPAKFTLESSRVCTKDSVRSDRSYKTSVTRFVLAGLKPLETQLVKIIKSETKTLKTNRCGYGAIPITQSLTPYADSYEDNIYAVNGKKLKDLPERKPPKC